MDVDVGCQRSRYGMYEELKQLGRQSAEHTHQQSEKNKERTLGYVMFPPHEKSHEKVVKAVVVDILLSHVYFLPWKITGPCR